ncbi:NUDIX domain-containing protein [Patescibacteria group bacterium]|nr:NUDIX domain-containing protein [Patescibacteria group bacterium]
MDEKLTKIKEDLYYDERSAGGIVFKRENGQVRWLLIKVMASSRYRNRHGQRMVYKFPKGHLKSGEFLKTAALREAEEEGKVKAEIVAKIGSNNYVFYDKLKKRKIIKKVTFFLMEYRGQSDSRYTDAEMIVGREWLSYEQANLALAYDSEKVLLKKAKMRLK